MKSLLFLLCFLSTFATFAASYDDAISAAKMNDANGLNKILAKGLSPNTTDAQGNSILLLAAREGSKDAVDIILRYSPDIDAPNMVGDTALKIAAYNGHLTIVKMLLQSGASLESDDWSALTYAALNAHTEVAEFLIKKGADVNAPSKNGTTPLMAAARRGAFDLVKILVAKKANLHAATDRGETAVDIALKRGNTEIAEYLMAQGATANKKAPKK